MFDFEKLGVYTKAKNYYKTVTMFLQKRKQDRVTNDQLRRSSFSIMLNVAEGSGRFTNRDKRRFYVIARGSVFEYVATFDYLKEVDSIDENLYHQFYKKLEELSIMLFSSIRGLS